MALAFVGLLVGAGFATGQEVIQYFISFGYAGLIGVVVASVIMIFAGAVIFQLGSYFLAPDHNTVFRNVTARLGGTWYKRVSPLQFEHPLLPRLHSLALLDAQLFQPNVVKE